jgi:hypothetical protein
MSAFMLIQKSPQRSRLEFLRAYAISLKGSAQLSFLIYYKLIYNQKQENMLGQYNIPFRRCPHSFSLSCTAVDFRLGERGQL